MALDDLDDRFAAAVKMALGTSRGLGDEEADGSGRECPSSDAIASYYENALPRLERTRLETHISGCARCQGTLAVLLRAAPTVDAVSEAGEFAPAARRAANESGVRERWLEVSRAWRVAGVTAAATAMLAVAVVAGLHVYQSRIGKEREQIAALSAAPQHNRDEPRPFGASSPSRDAELALNDKKKSLTRAEPAAPAEPQTMAAPSAAAPPVSASTTPAASSNAPAEATIPSQEAAPPANPDQNGAGTSSAAQAVAVLGALAATPESAASATPSSVPAPSAAAAPPVAALPIGATPVTAAPATAAASSAAAPAATASTQAAKIAIAGAPIGGVAAMGAAGAAGAAVAAKSAAPPASQLARLSTPPQTSEPARGRNSLPSGNLGAPANTAAGSPPAAQQRAQAQFAQDQLAQQRLAQEQLEKDRLAQQRLAQEKIAKDKLAEEKRKAALAQQADLARRADLARKAELARKVDLARKADLARKTEQARHDADLKRQLDQSRREAQAEAAAASSAANAPQTQSIAPLRMETASAPRQFQSATGSAGASNQITMAERPVASAPMVAAIAPGIPVAPHAVLVSSPNHAVYWSLQNSGVIYRTNDRKSWAPQYTGVQADLLAGTAPSDTVCWAVGRKGAILLTTDGTHWERINSPTSSDVIGIVAASKDVATIFTAGGINYSTFDGGSNWEQAN